MAGRKHDLTGLSVAELKELIVEAEAAIKTRVSEDLKKAREAVEAAAKDFGFSLEEVIGGQGLKKNVKMPPKFRNPDNPEETWSGRGRQPGWFIAAMEGGKSEEDLRI